MSHIQSYGRLLSVPIKFRDSKSSPILMLILTAAWHILNGVITDCQKKSFYLDHHQLHWVIPYKGCMCQNYSEMWGWIIETSKVAGNKVFLLKVKKPWLSEWYVKAVFQHSCQIFFQVVQLRVSASICGPFERSVSHINHLLISWRTGGLSQQPNQIPPSAVSARYPSIHLLVCPSRSEVEAGGRGGAGCSRTGSAAHSE